MRRPVGGAATITLADEISLLYGRDALGKSCGAKIDKLKCQTRIIVPASRPAFPASALDKRSARANGQVKIKPAPEHHVKHPDAWNLASKDRVFDV